MKVLWTFSEMKLFSFYGLLAIILILILNIIFAKEKHQAKVDDADTCGFAVCMLELIFKFVTVGSIILIRMPRLSIGFLIAAGIVLLLYYFAWGKYYNDGAYYPDIYTESFLGIPFPMTVLSNLYYILISLWLGNIIALCATLISGTCQLLNANAARKDFKCRMLNN